MFSGIIQSMGRVAGVGACRAGRRLRVEGRLPGGRFRIGESVSVEGVCLTVERSVARGFQATIVPETLRLTTLGALREGDPINLERALRFNDLVGGHLIQGHVDGVGRVRAWSGTRGERRLRIWSPAPIRLDLVTKGSVAVSGVSLTVAALTADGFEVALVPHTLSITTLGGLEEGNLVNLEVDLLARYIRNLLAPMRKGSRGGVPRASAGRRRAGTGS
ncbi:MAG: riboflavin synthase [Acidobacteriota bacterium]